MKYLLILAIVTSLNVDAKLFVYKTNGMSRMFDIRGQEYNQVIKLVAKFKCYGDKKCKNYVTQKILEKYFKNREVR